MVPAISDINFLPQDIFLTQEETKRRQTIIFGSVVALCVYLAVVAGVLIATGAFALQKKLLDDSIAQTTVQIKSNQQKEILYYTITDRLKKLTPLLATVLDGKSEVQSMFRIKQLFPQEITINSIEIKSGKMEIGFSVVDPNFIQQFISAYSPQVGQTNFSQVVLSGLDRSGNSPYEGVLVFSTPATIKTSTNTNKKSDIESELAP